MPSPLDLARLRAGLPNHDLGAPLIYEPEIPSTNSLALRLIREDALAPGAIIVTDSQPAGRGRLGRPWITLPEEQILLSIILAPAFAPHWLVLAAALAVADAVVVAGVPAERVALKWPNDLLVDGRKAAGILIETTPLADGRRAAVIGLGLNVNGSLAPWPAVAATATTLQDACGRPFDRETIILATLDRLGATIGDLERDRTAAVALRARWRDRLATLGQTVTVRQGDETVTGRAVDVDGDGGLILHLPDGARRVITWGDVAATG